MDPFGRSATLISGGHAALDVAGLVPGAGMLFDLANGVWYASEGDWSMAGLSMLGAVPIVGDAATGAKIGVKAVKAGGEALEGAAKLGAKAEKAAGEGLVFGSATKSSMKISNQMAKRGWTEGSVRDIVDSPFTTRKSANKSTGNSATAYYTKEGAYVVVDDVTKEVVQVSDRTRPWFPDDTIVDPYLP